MLVMEMHALAGKVYDVVVELDDSMNIAEDVHCLGTWLRHGRRDLSAFAH